MVCQLATGREMGFLLLFFLFSEIRTNERTDSCVASKKFGSMGSHGSNLYIYIYIAALFLRNVTLLIFQSTMLPFPNRNVHT